MARQITKLDSLFTGELSLVKRGANARRFAVTKGMDMDLQEVFQSVLTTEAEGEKALLETLKSAGIEEDAIQVAVAHYRLQNGFKDKVSKEAFEQVTKAAGYKQAPGEGDDDDPEMMKKKKAAAALAATKKAAPRDTTPSGMPPEMEAVWKSQQKAISDANDRADKLEATLEVVQKEAKRKEYVAKCDAEYKHVPGMSSDEMAEMLMTAYGVSKEFGEQLEKQWTQTGEAVKKSALLRAQGGASTVSGGSAWDKMQSLAKERVQKSAGKVGASQAMDEIMQENPDLYQEYLGENPAQSGRRY